MAEDIVKRLRVRPGPLAQEAADVIVELRKQVKKLKRRLESKRFRDDGPLFALPDDAVGGARRSDPPTSKHAARKANVTFLMYGAMISLLDQPTPLNNSEMAAVLVDREIAGKKWNRDWVSPRMTTLLSRGWVEEAGFRPGPTGLPQTAYVLTPLGREQLAALREPPKPRGERKKKGPE